VTSIKLKHVDSFRDRYGQRRYYFRRGHGRRVALPDVPGSVAFMKAYQSALAGVARGLFAAAERQVVLDMLARSVVFLTPTPSRLY
jgi:hypothetical protein